MLETYLVYFTPFYLFGVIVFATLLGVQHEVYTHKNPRFNEGPGHAVIIALFWPVTLLVVAGYLSSAMWRKYLQ